MKQPVFGEVKCVYLYVGVLARVYEADISIRHHCFYL